MRNTLTAIAKSSLLGAVLVCAGSVLYAEKNLYLGVNASLVLSETWIIGYSGSVARATGLDNPSQSKLELKNCGSLCRRCSREVLQKPKLGAQAASLARIHARGPGRA